MKHLKEIVCESIFDGEEALLKGIDGEIPKTLLDCLSGYVVSSFDRTWGPSHYPDIVEASKILKKKYKPKDLLDRNGKKSNPGILAHMVAAVASQVEIDWDLDPQKRLEKAIDDFNEKYSEFRENELKDLDAPSIIAHSFDIGFARHQGGRKTVVNRNDRIASISAHFKTGRLSLSVLAASPISIDTSEN